MSLIKRPSPSPKDKAAVLMCLEAMPSWDHAMCSYANCRADRLKAKYIKLLRHRHLRRCSSDRAMGIKLPLPDKTYFLKACTPAMALERVMNQETLEKTDLKETLLENELKDESPRVKPVPISAEEVRVLLASNDHWVRERRLHDFNRGFDDFVKAQRYLFCDMEDSFKKLVSESPDIIHMKFKNRGTLLITAATMGATELVRFLLSMGALPDESLDHDFDRGEWTALMWAAYSNREEVVSLLAPVSDLSRKDSLNRDSADIAEMKGFKGISNFIRALRLSQQEQTVLSLQVLNASHRKSSALISSSL